MYNKAIKKRFWDKVNKTDYCWEWTSYFKTDKRFKEGTTYGFFWLNGKRNCRAHRVSWEIHFGEIPEGMCVCHHCDNPKCVRPDHLFLGTMADNNKDMIKKGRGNVGAPGKLNSSAKLTEKQVLEIRTLHQTGQMSQKNLGKMFNVTETNIVYIVKRKTWKNI